MQNIKIDCISDLHGHYPKLYGGDLLIIAGDLTARDTDEQHRDFILWISNHQKHDFPYKKIIYIGGNHDGFLDPKNKRYGAIKTPEEWNIEYLCDSGTEFQGLKIWGSPWSLTFPGINHKCTAFTGTEKELEKKYDLIPDDIDILITHGPPYGILDKVKNRNVGSLSLAVKIGHMENPPKLWVCGHIHECYGEDFPIRSKPCRIINASHVNEYYEPVNKPIRIIL